MSELVLRARKFAEVAHAGQMRKHGNRPYIYHPGSVAVYLCSQGHGENHELVAAAWLHDTVEDCVDVAYNTLEEAFGSPVASLVAEVTKPAASGSRKARWQQYLQHYENASHLGKVLKLADRVANLREYLDYWSLVPREAKRFLDTRYLDESAELLDSLSGTDINIEDDLQKIIYQLDCLLTKDNEVG